MGDISIFVRNASHRRHSQLGGSITNDILRTYQTSWVIIYFFLMFWLLMWNDHFSYLQDYLKIYEFNQRLKLWAHVSTALNSCPATTHTYRGNPFTINLHQFLALKKIQGSRRKQLEISNNHFILIYKT